MAAAGNGNSSLAQLWERAAIALLAAMVSGLVALAWDMRQELTLVRDRQNEWGKIIERVPVIETMVNQQAIRQAVTDKDILLVRELTYTRLNLLDRRVNGLALRQDKVVPRDGVYYEDGP